MSDELMNANPETMSLAELEEFLLTVEKWPRALVDDYIAQRRDEESPKP